MTKGLWMGYRGPTVKEKSKLETQFGITQLIVEEAESCSAEQVIERLDREQQESQVACDTVIFLGSRQEQLKVAQRNISVLEPVESTIDPAYSSMSHRSEPNGSGCRRKYYYLKKFDQIASINI